MGRASSYGLRVQPCCPYKHTGGNGALTWLLHLCSLASPCECLSQLP